MKKLWKFLQSMKFGLILLGLIVLFSIAGSLITQNESAMTYVHQYSSWYQILFFLQLNHVFTSWYFIVTTILLCINLSMCSILRFRRISAEKAEETAFSAKADVKLEEKEIETVKETLRKLHCKEETRKGVTVFHKNAVGRYGTFITHLGILLTVIFFALAMYLPVTIDRSCMPGESITLDDGTDIHVDNFSIEDETGDLDYKSAIEVTLPDGRKSGKKETSVNHPVSFGSYKIYQQTYGTMGIIKVSDEAGNEDSFYMDQSMFLSKDGKTGVFFNALYPDIELKEGGGYSLETSTSGHYENPVYTFNLVERNEDASSENDTKMTPMLAFPGDEVTVEGITYHFETPVEYPGLRIKKTPALINLLLGLSVLVLTVGLAVTFLMTPVLVTVTEEGMHIFGNKSEGIRLALKQALRKKEKGKQS